MVSQDVAHEGFIFPENHTVNFWDIVYTLMHTAAKCQKFKVGEARGKGLPTPAAPFYTALLSGNDTISKM